jgi:hypothetical protein
MMSPKPIKDDKTATSEHKPFLVYVGGKYRGKTVFHVIWNILKARKVSMWLWRHQISNICPHTNSALIDYGMDKVPDDFILPAYLDILKRCDAMVLVSGWSDSVGTLAEIELATKMNIPIYYDPEHLYYKIKTVR